MTKLSDMWLMDIREYLEKNDAKTKKQPETQTNHAETEDHATSSRSEPEQRSD